MKITVENFRGLRLAELDAPDNKITLIGGQNGRGKTSMAQAIAACLGSHGVPIAGLKKSDVSFLIRSGAREGFAELSTDGGTVRIDWPKAEVSTKGAHYLQASDYAIGYSSLVDMKAPAIARTMTEMLEADPTRADLEASMKEAEIESGSDKVWQMIEQLGWESAEKQMRERGIGYKAQWEAITGERYGSKKAESWMPQVWDVAADATTETLQADVDSHRQSLEAALQVGAVDHAERSRLQEQAGRQDDLAHRLEQAASAEREAIDAEHAARQAVIDFNSSVGRRKLQTKAATLKDCQEALVEAKKRHTSAETAASVAAAELHNHPAPDAAVQSQPCPHCQAALSIEGSRIVSAEGGRAPEQVEALQKAHDQAKQANNNALTHLRQTGTELHQADQAVNEAEEAAAQLKELGGPVGDDAGADRESLQAAMKSASETARERAAEKHRLEYELEQASTAAKRLAGMSDANTSDAGDIESARETLAQAESRLESFEAYHGALKLHRRIEANTKLVTLLSADGMRKELLYAKVRQWVRQHVQPLTGAAKWLEVDFDRDMELSYGGRRYALLSESEKYRVRVALQVGMAMFDGSKAVVIDAADILDQPSRGGLMKLLMAYGGTSVVTMTLSNRDKLPDLASRDMGASYWIENGELVGHELVVS